MYYVYYDYDHYDPNGVDLREFDTKEEALQFVETFIDKQDRKDTSRFNMAKEVLVIIEGKELSIIKKPGTTELDFSE
jgi:hypothetical protein